MKHLTILRHGKAAPGDTSDRDFQRPLTKGGCKQVKRATRTVKRLPSPVQLIVSSPAQRAKETAEILAQQIDYGQRILWREDVYAASAQNLLTVLSTLPEDGEHVVLIGHNPGLRDLISVLCTGATNQLNLHLRSGGMAHLRLEIFWWKQIRWGCGELRLLVPPKLTSK